MWQIFSMEKKLPKIVTLALMTLKAFKISELKDVAKIQANVYPQISLLTSVISVTFGHWLALVLGRWVIVHLAVVSGRRKCLSVNDLSSICQTYHWQSFLLEENEYGDHNKIWFLFDLEKRSGKSWNFGNGDLLRPSWIWSFSVWYFGLETFCSMDWKELHNINLKISWKDKKLQSMEFEISRQNFTLI